MRFFAAGAIAILIVVQLGGCARTNQTVAAQPVPVGKGSQPIAAGVKPASHVSPCCRPLAEGRVGLDQCMLNPQCMANNNSCCMNAIQ